MDNDNETTSDSNKEDSAADPNCPRRMSVKKDTPGSEALLPDSKESDDIQDSD